MSKSPRGHSLHGCNAIGITTSTISNVITSSDDFATSNADKYNTFTFPWLKACGIPSSYVEAHAICFPSIKDQVRIYFNKMIMASNLNWPVSLVDNSETYCTPSRVKNQIFTSKYYLSWNSMIFFVLCKLVQ
ncbi:hypothetical protein V8G54_018332 [Vigna mungo]|uniref:Uncharacterized protein n=1 Tax=Vigna mungo TaxID=3915 RepID=A0AAQ3N9X6_VIGMU